MAKNKRPLTPLEKVLLGKGFLSTRHQFTRNQADAYMDARDRGADMSTALRAAKSA